MQVLPCTLATLLDPDGISPTSRYRLVLSACGIKDYLGFRSVYLTGLNRFTVSHCGSRTPMPTLKPHLTASAPRLSTDCSLCFVGQGLSPCCITCTVLAHPLLDSRSRVYPYFTAKSTTVQPVRRGCSTCAVWVFILRGRAVQFRAEYSETREEAPKE